MPYRLALSVCLVTLATGTGCTQGKPPVVPAGGKVMYKGTTPAVGALVVFHPASYEIEKQIGGKPFGRVREDGSFTLTTYEEGDGAPEGEYGVTIDWRGLPGDDKGKLVLSSEGSETKSVGPLRIHPKYANPQQPFTSVTIKKGQTNHFEFTVE